MPETTRVTVMLTAEQIQGRVREIAREIERDFPQEYAQHLSGSPQVRAHGGVLGMLRRHIANIPLAAPRTYAMPNASINRFSFKSGIWCLIAWGDLSHLDNLVHGEFNDSVASRFR